MAIYLLMALGWVVVSAGLGAYIRGRGWSGKKHYRIGLKTMLVFYFIGVSLLFLSVAFFS